MKGALQLAEKLTACGFVSGHGFSRAENANKMKGALAPEGCFSRIEPPCMPFSATCLAPANPSFVGFAFRSDFFSKLFRPCKSLLNEIATRAWGP
jgi:hypothetical protein